MMIVLIELTGICKKSCICKNHYHNKQRDRAIIEKLGLLIGILLSEGELFLNAAVS